MFESPTRDRSRQLELDRGTLSTRQFQVATASSEEITEAQRSHAAQAVEQTSRVSEVRSTASRVHRSTPPPDARPVGLSPADAQAMAVDAERALADATRIFEAAKLNAASARQVANTASKALGSVGLGQVGALGKDASKLLQDPNKLLKDPAKAVKDANTAISNGEKVVKDAKKVVGDVESAASAASKAAEAAKKLIPTGDSKDKKKTK